VSEPAVARPAVATVHRLVVLALPAIVLVQATLAGQHLFEGASISLHGILGNVTFALTALQVGLVVARRTEAREFVLAVTLMALAFAQVGLGYVGRETAAAGAWHIPVGVAIFGVACYQLAGVRGAPRDR
jgi:hypothetical protein